MSGFERHDDRASSMEAPVSQGFFLDASGANWANRPDNVIDKYMGKVVLSKDQYWKYKEYLDKREWFELDMYLERIAKSASQEDVIRINKSREVIKRMTTEKSQ